MNSIGHIPNTKQAANQPIDKHCSIMKGKQDGTASTQILFLFSPFTLPLIF